MTTAMTHRKHVRAILTLGLPLIGGHLAQMAIGVTDTVMLGWYSIEALAAGVLGSTFFFVLFIFGSGFGMAVMPLVAAYDAEDDEIGLRRATRMGLWLSIGFAMIALPVMIWSKPVLSLLGQEPELAALGGRYLSIAGWGIVPALLVMVLKSYLAALERTQVVLWITLGAAIVNALANYALIFGNWGAPELGVMGAAIASVTTHTVSLIGIVVYVLIALPQHSLFVRLWRVDPQMLLRVFRLGLPIGLTTLSEVGLFAASSLMMGWISTFALAAHGIAIQLVSLVFMVHLGLSNVATIRVGNAFGRRDAPHMARGAWIVIVLSVVFSLLTMIGFIGWPEALISLFMQESEPARLEIIAIGTGLLVMATLFQLVDGAQVVALGLLRGAQDTQVPMIMAAVSYWGVGVPCSYLLGFTFGYGALGVWAGLVAGLALAAVLLNARFWGQTIRRLNF
ncbi:MATE family efflux transporter [Sulfitobacter sp. S0837]|uniref:MATE family efflux transporter n=1 Tax=Sulfitobacter maritimus TaxID=2741719 RepID=UPI0015815B92|nr:MATE family efflux transporter [Sulfitobacter maritimus]NUH66031.1 MATE family efflux transporter [Sulfitobacter maritimus]